MAESTHHIEYVSDNPFRLLDASSYTSLREMRRHATAALRRHQVGLPPDTPTPLAQTLGTEGMEHLILTLDRMASDPHEALLYRLFWPSRTELLASATDLREMLASVEALEETTDGLSHVKFVLWWVGFCARTTARSLEKALDAWSLVYDDTINDQRLVDLVAQEYPERGDPVDLVLAALDRVEEVLARTVCRAAMAKWQERRGQRGNGLSLIRKLRSAALGEQAVELALAAEVTPAGDGACVTLRRLLDNAPEWSMACESYTGTDSEHLRLLACAVKDAIPAAYDWETTADRMDDHVAYALRARAVQVHNEDDDAGTALALVRKAQTVARSPDLLAKLTQDEETLREEARHQATKQQYGLEPVHSVPGLGTINGIGTKFYGRTPYEPDPTRYFATLYFVLIYIPIFAIARYLVSDEPSATGDPMSRVYRFYARTRLTPWNLRHNYCALLAAVCLVVWLVAFNSTSGETPNRQEPPPQASSIGNALSSAAPSREQESEKTDSDGSTWSSVYQENTERQKRKERLEVEYRKLNAEIQVLSDSIDAAKEKLSALSDELDTRRELLDLTDPDEVDKFNAMVRHYERDRHRHNRLVTDHNTKLHRIRVVVHALEEMGD